MPSTAKVRLVLRLLYDRLVVKGRTVIGQCLFVPIFLTFALSFERNLSAIVGDACLVVCALAAVLLCVTTRPPVRSSRTRNTPAIMKATPR
jgi:hypothetical protein